MDVKQGSGKTEGASATRGGTGQSLDDSGSAPSEAGGERVPSGGKHVFDFDDFEPQMSYSKRYALWRDVFIDQIGGCDVVPAEQEPFFSRSEYLPVGSIGVTRLAISMRSIERKTTHLGDARDDILVGFNGAGAVSGRHGSKDIEAKSGDLIVHTPAEPFHETYQGSYAAGTWLMLPRAVLGNVIANPERMFGMISGQSAAARHLLHYCELLLGDDVPVRDPALDFRIETMLLDLVALTLGANRDVTHLAKERGLRAARLMAIKADIRQNMGHSDFAVGAVARRHGVSTRYIHMLFEGEGKTFSEYVQDQRLREAHRLLTSSAYADTRIGEVAYAVGFSEQSTFNRLFKRAFGATPSDVRLASRS